MPSDQAGVPFWHINMFDKSLAREKYLKEYNIPLTSFEKRLKLFSDKSIRNITPKLPKHSYKLEGIDLMRERIRKRDKHTCRICFEVWKLGNRRFDVHHLEDENGKSIGSKKDYRYDRNNPDKMITLCHRCHLRLEYGHIPESAIDKSTIPN